MAAISSFSTPLHSISIPNFNNSRRILPIPNSIHLGTKSSRLFSSQNAALNSQKRELFQGIRKLRSAEGEALVTEPEADSAVQEEPVSVPVSASDTLTMHFQADGGFNESEIPKLTKALEGFEGISNLKVEVLEGIGTVELTKETTVQATGVSSSLVEIIQGAGFRLQTLNLSFEDEEDKILL